MTAAGQGADGLDPDVDRRLEQIAEAIVEISRLRFSARAPVGPAGDWVDAVAAGVNFLGGELAVTHKDLERQIAYRTAELTTAMRELEHQSLHDHLTGLATRALFWDRLSHRRNQADRRQAGYAVLFVDLDGFKAVNDTHGHVAGDRLLVEVAQRLLASVRKGDSVARVGGDEFTVLLDTVRTPADAMTVGRRVCRALKSPYQAVPEARSVSASVGVAVGPGAFESADDLVAAADAAMYAAKQGGGRAVVLHD